MSKLTASLTFALTAIVALALFGKQRHEQSPPAVNAAITLHGEAPVESGRQIFRYGTFGDQDYWVGALGFHQGIEGANLGGIGPGVSYATALAVGLNVDQAELPLELVQQISSPSDSRTPTRTNGGLSC